MKQPRVSIIVPVYNGEEFMREAIDSALAQTYENCEVIVVNDGSQDDTEKIALSYGDRIRYFSKPNGGVSTALNLGIEKMTGDYFAFLPHDDTYHPDKTKLQIESILNSGDEMTIAWSGFYCRDERRQQDRPVEISFGHTREALTRGTYPLFFGLLNAATALIHKRYFEIKGNFNPELLTAQDYDLCFRIFQGKNTIYLDQPLAVHRIHEQQGSQCIPEYEKNCMDLAFAMMQGITAPEIKRSFGSEYAFYCKLLDYYEIVQWETCKSYALRQIELSEEPKVAKRQREELRNWLFEEIPEQKIVLYCAGNNGKRLLRALQDRGVEVTAFCDSDSSRHGTMIQGKPCISPEQLKAFKGLIIVTNDGSQELKQQLLEQGFRNIVSHREVAENIYQALPQKEKILDSRRV